MTRSLCVAPLGTKSTTTPASCAGGTHDPPDSLLVDAPGGGGREVHADRRWGGFPAFREQSVVDQDVVLPALIGSQVFGEPGRGVRSGDGFRLEPGGAELLREVEVSTPPRRRCRGFLRSARDRGWQRPGSGPLVERGCRFVFLEVPADDRDRVDRCGRRRAGSGAEQSPASGGVAERQVVHGGGEDVGDLLFDRCSVAVIPMYSGP